MSYARRVEMQREHNRAVEERRKAKKRQASISGQKRAPKVEPVQGPSLLRRMWDTMSNWRSKKSLAAEAKRKAEAEKAKA